MSDTLNPENKCAALYEEVADKFPHQFRRDKDSPLEDCQWLDMMFKMQKALQIRVGLDIDNLPFDERVRLIKENWNYFTTEYVEMLERLPFKPWKTYTDEQQAGFIDEEHKLETWYEWVDMLHFFINMGLLIGIDASKAFNLYYTKNKENFARQDRGY